MDSDNLIQLTRFKKEPPHPSYISGFIDGDGTFFIRKIKDGYQSGITIAQSRTNILQVVRYHFGGTITTSANRNSKHEDDIDEDGTIHKYNKRNQYNLIVRSDEYKLLIDYIKNFVIIKQNQCDALYEFSKLANKPGYIDSKKILFDLCSVKKTIYSYDFNRLNVEYIQGLFDAEGCFYIDKTKISKYKISLTQKIHPQILNEIQRFLGFGKVTFENKYVIYNKENCLQFIELIKNGLIVKYNQAIAFETFLKTTDLYIKEKMYIICNEEKHKTENFLELNKNSIGKDGYLEIVNVKELKQRVCSQINLIGVYKEKSDKMKGSGNHNYGKTFSEETKKKMSKSIRDSKNGVSDETILDVRKLLSQGMLNVEIQEKLNLPRHTVTRIKNGHIVCRNEDKIENVPLTKDQINAAKRKIKLDEIFVVIEKYVENKSPSDTLEYLSITRVQKNINNNLTIDIIKNIRKKLSNIQVPFYPFETSTEKYNYYKNMIENCSKVKE
jgi:hypothetical protein